MKMKHQLHQITVKKKEIFITLEKSDNTQNITDYTKQEFKGSSSTNKIYQNTAIKIRP